MTEFAIADGRPLAETEPTGPEPTADAFATLALSAIVPSLTNPRAHFDEAKLAELAESIKAQGVGQPILVRPLPHNRLDQTSRKVGRAQRETYEIISGERRWRASKLAGKTSIPVLIRAWDDVQVLTFQLVENLQRDDLSELEEAEGYQRLIDQADMAKEIIGERIGKSRSYVYQRLKLLDLDPAGREALRKGEIDFSKALLVARVPDAKLQIKALGQATGSDNHGRALPVKELQAWLQTNVMLSLKRTSFDIQDVTLREGAGACPECPKRTGANPDLFADVDSADLCTDPGCYHDKEKTAAERRFEAAQAEGKKVIEQAKAGKLFDKHARQWLQGYYLLDEYPDHRLDLDGLTLRKALGKHCPEPVLVEHPETGDVHEVAPTEQVRRIVDANGLSRQAKREARQAARAGKEAAKTGPLPVEQRREFTDRWRAAVLRRTDIYLQTQDALPAELMRAWLLDRFEGYDEGAFGPALGLGDEVNTKEARARIVSMPEAELPRLMLRFLLWSSEDEYEAWDEEKARRQGPRTTLFELIHMAGVGIDDARAEVKREMESEDRAATLAEEQAIAEKASKSKKSTASPAARAASSRGKPKASEGEARDGIAAALQAADGESDQAPGGAEQPEAAALAAAPLAPVTAWPFPDEFPQATAASAFHKGQGVRVTTDDGKLRLKLDKYAGKTGTVTSVVGGLVTVTFKGRTGGVADFEPGELEVPA